MTVAAVTEAPPLLPTRVLGAYPALLAGIAMAMAVPALLIARFDLR